MARDEGVTGIVAQHLAIPVTCHPKLFSKIPNGENLELLSYVQNHDAALVDAHRMEVFWDLYTGLDPGVDFRHSPLLCEDLKGLPPTCKSFQSQNYPHGCDLEAQTLTEIIQYSRLPDVTL